MPLVNPPTGGTDSTKVLKAGDTMTGALIANATGSGTTGAISTNWLTVRAPDGVAGTASLFLDNGASATPKVWEIFGKGDGSMGFYDKAAVLQQMTILHASGYIGLGNSTRTPTERLQVDGNVAPLTNNTNTLGTSSLYWSNLYANRHYLNSTAYIDGSSAGTLAVTGTLTATSPTFTTPNIGAATGTSVVLTGAITSSGTAGIGYASGAGGTVSQATSRTTGVTLSKLSGKITLFSTTLAADTDVSFVWTNTLIAATDVVVFNVVSGAAVKGGYYVNAIPAAGSATVTVHNLTPTITTTEAPVLQFVVIKGVSA